MNAIVGRHAGFTLIELLVVVVLMTGVASVTAIGLAGIDELTSHQAVTNRLTDSDARARQHARTGTPVELILTDASTLVIRSIRQGEWISQAAFPEEWTVHMMTDKPVTSVRVDAAGRTPSYAMSVVRRGFVRTVRFVGATGRATVEEAP